MSLHAEQVTSVLSRAVQSVLTRGLNDPRVQGLISVTRVDLSRDMANATIYVSVMPEEQAALTLHGLRHAARHVRTQVGRNVRLRRMPHLAFKLDESIKKEAAVIAAINEAKREDERRLSRANPNPPSEDLEP